MRLRHTIILTICALFLGMALTVYASLHLLLDRHFEALEYNQAVTNARRAVHALKMEWTALDQLTWDWASWDDSYEFALSHSNSYLRSNLMDTTFLEQRLDFIIFTDTDGDLIWGKSLDRATGTILPLPDALLQRLRPGGPLYNVDMPSQPRRGLLRLHDGPCIVAARPILPSEGDGTARGTLLMGRYITDSDINRLQDITRLRLRLLSPLDPDLPLAGKIAPGDAHVVPLNEHSLHAYTAIGGLSGTTAAIIRVDMDRLVHVQGMNVLHGTLVPLLLVAALFTFGAVLLLHRKILWRLGLLGEQVADISANSDAVETLPRVRVSGHDEVAELAQGVNLMLAELEKSRTELARRAKESRENENFLERLLNSVQAGIVLVDPKTREVVEANDFALQLIGSEKAELLGRMCQKTFCLATNGRCPILDERQEVALKQCQLRRSDGTHLEIIKSVTTVERRGRSYLLESFIDITDVHQAQQALREAHVQMEATIEDRTRDLQQANRELRKLNRLKSTFLNSASHELRTPLTSVVGFVKLMEKQFVKWFEPLAGGDAELKKRAEDFLSNFSIMKLESERLRRLINDMLDLSRIESGRMQWRDEPVDMVQLLREVAASLAPHFAERETVDMEIDLPESLPQLQADPDRIKQVVLNLLNNADKFTASGTVRLHAEAGEDGFLTVSVSDTGKGIPAGEVGRIFDVFFQSTLTGGAEEMPGTGLGLAICREIVNHYEGTIWVESEEGKGTTFSFTLPTAEASF